MTKTAIDDIPFGLGLTTPDGRILDCNEILMRMLGYKDKEELRAVALQDLYVHSARRRELMAHLEAHDTAWDYRAMLKCKDSRHKAFNISCTLYQVNGSTVILAVVEEAR